jgi:aryl-alcohol dehydrogenase-like predicted oxidoreductase
METRKLGSQGLEVSAIGLGCLSMSDFYGTAEEHEAFETVARALELGVTFLDTADCYGPFTNEEIVGRAIRGQRESFVIATKFGFIRERSGAWLGLDARPERVAGACEDSLRRLGIEQIDLYYLHCPDPNVPIEETVGAMGELVSAGKVRCIGISNATPDHVRRAHAAHPLTAVQNDFSLAVREPERELIPCLRELGVGLVAFSPLARGLLSGTVRSVGEMFEGDFRRHLSTFGDGNLERNLELIERLGELAAGYGATAAQLALAWVLAQGPDVVPIPGTARRAKLEANVAAAELRINADDLATIDALFAPGAVAGSNTWTREENVAANAARAAALTASGQADGAA